MLCASVLVCWSMCDDVPVLSVFLEERFIPLDFVSEKLKLALMVRVLPGLLNLWL